MRIYLGITYWFEKLIRLFVSHKPVDEGCDDGNYIADDGCTNCIIDVGYSCTTATPNVCSSLCGNGIMNVDEVKFLL